jgi:NADPH-dependent ferric siderophore reductase
VPEMPAFLANFLEPRFAKVAHVAEVEDLAPHLRRVRFAGAALRGVAFRAGQEIEFRVSDRAFRHYTPASFDPEQGIFDVLFFLHGRGPGSAWASALRHAQPVKVLGPGGGFRLAEDVTTHVFLGDETSLGVFRAMRAATATRVIGAVEVDAGAEGWTGLAGLDLPAVARDGRRGGALRRWLDGFRERPSDVAAFYLVGHAATIVELREALLARGWPRRAIRSKAYWADGRRGL